MIIVLGCPGVDRAVKLWDLRSVKLLQYYSAHTQPVAALDFDPSGDVLLSCGDVTTKARVPIYFLR